MKSRQPVILFSSAGRRVALQRIFRESAESLGWSARILATDVRPQWSAACARADAAFAVPRCDSPEFIPALLEICRAEQVDLVVPTIDPELAPLSRARSAFETLGTRVMVSSPSVVALADSKAAFARFLADRGIASPRTMLVEDLLKAPAALGWPVMVKPDCGSSSIGVRRVDNEDDLKSVPPFGFIAQQLLAGQEFTINMFFDRGGVLRCAVPHHRVEVRAGEVSKGETTRLAVLSETAQRLGGVLKGAEGALCVQGFCDADGRFSLIELNARFGGGYPLADFSGGTFAKWLLQEIAREPCAASDSWRAGVRMLRYDDAVFEEQAPAE